MKRYYNGKEIEHFNNRLQQASLKYSENFREYTSVQDLKSRD